MRYLIYLQLFVIFIGDYVLTKLGFDSGIFAILPEIISLIAGMYALLYFAIYKGAKIQWRYLFFGAAFMVHIAIGIIGNQVQPLAVFAGMRTYLKFLPFYLLPLVYDQTDDQAQSQLKLLLVFAILQLPLALYQRFFEYHIASGDYIAGTLTAAPMLSIYLIGVIAVIMGYYLKKRLTVKTFMLLVTIAFIPTAINETKATVILLPLAILVPTLFQVGRESRIKILVTVIPLGLLMIVGYQYIYKGLYTGRSDVLSFYTSGKAQDYLYKGAQAQDVTGKSESEVGRIDSIILAYKENSRDLFRLVWGVGIGNAAVSFSRKFQGKYVDEYLRLGGKKTGLSHFIWEIGLLGVAHILWFLLLVFLDALALRKGKDVVGPLALGWLGVTAIFLISLPYQNLITKNELIYPFSYLSGFLAARAYIFARVSRNAETFSPATVAN